MKASDIEEAARLMNQRIFFQSNIAAAERGLWGSAGYFDTTLGEANCDDEMAEAIRGAIRAELTRRCEKVDEELRSLGVEIDGGAE